jgi:hypothetical protein
LVEIEVPGSSRDLKTNEFTPKKKKELSGFSLFVQKHSTTVRNRMKAEALASDGGRTISQPEVMKECGRLWKIEKEKCHLT